jgi:glycosyltransferase involved in cell wall biosynthesis
MVSNVSMGKCGPDLKIVVGIPALNEEQFIAKVIVRSLQHADKVVVVDDGSDDDTALIAGSLGAVVIRHERNLGYGAALRDCFEWARQFGADILITLDADGQHDPSEIPILMGELRSTQADVVIGSRRNRPSDMPRYRWLGKHMLDLATHVRVRERLLDTQSGFRAYSRKAIEALVPVEYGMGADSVLLMQAKRAGMRIVDVPVIHRYTGLETSSHNPVKHWLDVLLSILKFISISHPLTFYGGCGIASLLVSLMFGIMTLDYYRQWGRVVTNLALVSVAAGVLGFLFLFTGIILFTLITVVRERRR